MAVIPRRVTCCLSAKLLPGLGAAPLGRLLFAGVRIACAPREAFPQESDLEEYMSFFICVYVFLHLPLCLHCSRGSCFNWMTMLNASVQAHQLVFFRNILNQSVFPVGEGGSRLPWCCLKQHWVSAPLSALLGDVSLGLLYV